MSKEPHLYAHVAPKARPLLDLLVQPLTMEAVGRGMGYSDGDGLQRMTSGLMDALGIDRQGGPSQAWRISLTRMYFGVDPCWCGYGMTASE